MTWLVPLPRTIAGAVCVLGGLLPERQRLPVRSPQFTLNMEGRDPNSVRSEQAQAVIGMLAELFGTPNEPLVPEGVELDPALLAMAAGPVGGDAQGISADSTGGTV